MKVLAVEILAFVISFFSSGVEADTFLAQPASLRGVSSEEVANEPGLREELVQVLPASELDAPSQRAIRLEEAMKATFTAMPKGESGTLGASASRYVLHRLLVQQHGWQLQGLDPSGGNWSTSSPTIAFGDRLSDEAKAIMDRRLEQNGFSLADLALTGALLEHMVHGQIESQLNSIFAALDHHTGEALSEPDAVRVIDAYMASYILGANSSAMTPQMLQQFNSTIEEQHPSWPETQVFLRQVQQEVRPTTEKYFLNDIIDVVEAAADRFGQWQSKECLALKAELVSLEEAEGTGRVRLADFYSSAINGGKWQFSETADYLRQLGAIDDTDPTGPRVIIPNYIYSPSNCLASSSFYAVCCIDECEELLDHLEANVGKPTATPEEIIQLVESLPAASGNSSVPAALVQKLTDVAEHHEGRIPLHGRLLGQWLHHARPRECPYPHLSGTTAPQRPEDWEVIAGQGATATEEEMAQHIEAAGQKKDQPKTEDESLCSAMWSMEEELVDARAHEESAELTGSTGSALGMRVAVRSAAVLAAGVSMVLMLVKTLKPAHGMGGPFCKADKLPRYSV